MLGTCNLTFDGHTAPVKSVCWINVGKRYNLSRLVQVHDLRLK